MNNLPIVILSIDKEEDTVLISFLYFKIERNVRFINHCIVPFYPATVLKKRVCVFKTVFGQAWFELYCASYYSPLCSLY